MKKATLSLLLSVAVLLSTSTFAAEFPSISNQNTLVATPSFDEVAYYVLNRFDATVIAIERIEGTEKLLVTCENERIILLETKGDVIISGNEMPNQ